MAKYKSHRKLLDKVLPEVIMRPDEALEYLAIYWSKGKCPIASKVKKGLANSLHKFDEYQLAKWNRKTEIKLRDVFRMCHPKPKDSAQSEMWKRLIEGNLKTPDTWEVALSRGEDKKAVWERLLTERKLGAMALLMNLRNMSNVGVDDRLIRDYFGRINASRLFPSRFITAAHYAPQLEPELEAAMLRGLNAHDKMPGKTVLLVDVSGSMDWSLSGGIGRGSEATRMDSACGLAIMLREICEDIDIYTFSLKLKRIPPRHGFALRDAIISSQDHNATYLGLAVKSLYGKRGKKYSIPGRYRGNITMEGQGLNPDRLIVITDEQSHDPVPDPNSKGFMINVASAQNGVGYGSWIHCDGWSDAVVKWIQVMEQEGFV